MRVIYIDVLFGVNLAIDYLLLCGTSRLSGIFTERFRLAFGAAFGAAYAVFSCFPSFAALSLLPIQLISGLFMVRIAFGSRKIDELLTISTLFLFLSCAMAGAAFALGKVTDVSFFTGSGYYIDVPFRVVAAAAALSWVATGFLFRGRARDRVENRPCAQVKLCFHGRQATYHLLIDTGNSLTDPVSGRPALILDRRAAARLLPTETAVPLAGLTTENAPAVLAALPGAYCTAFQLIPYRAIGKNHGLLLAFRPDSATYNGKAWNGLAAISPERVADGQYEGLI